MSSGSNIITLVGAVYPRMDQNIEDTAENREKYKVPTGAKLTVKLQDTMRVDAAATDVVEHVAELADKSAEWPQHFTLKIDLDKLDERNDYTISARVEKDGKLWALNDVRTVAVKAGKRVQGNNEVGLQVELKVVGVAPAAAAAAAAPAAAAASPKAAESGVTSLFGAVYPRLDANIEDTAENRAKYKVPAGAKLTVKLQDTMRADAAAIDIAEHVSELAEKSEWPQHFVLKIDLDKLDERFDYSISARVEKDGKLWGINDTRIVGVKAGKRVQRNGEVGIQVELKVI
ncbi:hypothetical protein DFJ74DRAFT_739608 [Hyaloraphidium curvatum]|nr:hypothetical protein DFJ74DRAFT_739608 [Hyaloraphidium curvatum]